MEPEVFYKVQDHYLETLFKELKFLEYNQSFEECVNDPGSRTDKTLWTTHTAVSQKGNNLKALKRISKILVSLPFELNAKGNFACQAAEAIAVAYYAEDKGFHVMHLDSSFGD